MENTNDWRKAQDASERGEWSRTDADEDESTQLRNDALEDFSNDSIFAGNGDRDDKDESNDAEDLVADDSDDDDTRTNDWGSVDPQSGGFPTGNEPSAPGSAV
ncbi:MAG TPA: hypothetical protein VGB43_04110 [Flavobacterium sp.]|jgi:hypothetical protein